MTWGMAHRDETPGTAVRVGHLQATWTDLGTAAGSVTIGCRRLQIEPGGWSTPAHEHGRGEEIFYVLAGRGLVWQKGAAFEVGENDCVVFLPNRGAHTVQAGDEPLDVLAFGPRISEEAPRFPRLGMTLVGRRMVESTPGVIDRAPAQFVREAELGPPDTSTRVERPATCVNLADVEPEPLERPRVGRVRRRIAHAAGARTTGMQHVEVTPGKEATAQHCHSVEEELFVVLAGDGAVLVDDGEHPVRAGDVVAFPAGTGVTHTFRAGDGGLTYLAYGTNDPGDICWYPRSSKLSFRGVGVIARVERLEYWDGED